MHAIAIDLRPLLAVPAKVRELPTVADDTSLPEDSELVRRALRGDRWAEDMLYRRHVRVVARVVTRLSGRSHEAEDVVQEAFISAFRDLHRLRQVESFRSWLLQLAVNLVHRRFRRRRLLRSLGLDREQDDATLLQQLDPRVDLELHAEIGKLDDLLRRRPTQERIAWMLRYVEQYRLEEVAEACGCSVATVKRRIARTQERVLAHLSIDFVVGE